MSHPVTRLGAISGAGATGTFLGVTVGIILGIIIAVIAAMIIFSRFTVSTVDQTAAPESFTNEDTQVITPADSSLATQLAITNKKWLNAAFE